MAIEDTMAQLANSQVTQSMPSLRDYIEGFQLITSNEENNAAIGVEIGMLGNTCIYIPAIYRNGKIYDMDIMYIPEMDSVSRQLGVYAEIEKAGYVGSVERA